MQQRAVGQTGFDQIIETVIEQNLWIIDHDEVDADEHLEHAFIQIEVNRSSRLWISPGPVEDGFVAFAPDGCTLDAEGGVWVADALFNRVSRVLDGRIVDTIQSPDGLGLYSCALGGEDGKTLLMCMAPDFDHVARAERSEGALYTCEVGVPRA